MSWALTGARACWHHGLEVERHSHRKAVEELLVLLIWFGSWGLADSLNVAGSSQDTPWSGSAFQTMQKSIFSLRCFSFSLFIYILNSNTQLLRSMSACCFLVEWLVLESQTHVGWCSFSSPADLYVLSTALWQQECLSITWENCGVSILSWGLQTFHSSQVMHSSKECGLLQLEITGMAFEGKGV